MVSRFNERVNMLSVMHIIKGTPYWVWLVLVYLLVIGMESLKKRKVYLWRLAILPIVFIAWSLYSLKGRMIFALVLCSCAWFIGILFGRRFVKNLGIKIDPRTREIVIPGSVVPLLISLGFFMIKYGFGVSYALNPALKASIIFVGCDAVASGIFSGFSFGRFLQILRKYREQ